MGLFLAFLGGIAPAKVIWNFGTDFQGHDIEDVGTLTATTLNVTTVSVAGDVAIAGDLNVTGTIDAGALDNTPVGAVTVSTGAFTTLDATGQITSTLADGTAPITVTSTTLCPNLNADRLDSKDESEFADLSENEIVTGNYTFEGNFTISNATVVLTGDDWQNSEVADDLTMDGGTIDDSPIGGTTPAAATCTTVSAQTITSTGAVIAGGANTITFQDGGGTIATEDDGDINLTPNGSGKVKTSAADISGGNINGTPIGGTTPAAATCTTVAAQTITSTGAVIAGGANTITFQDGGGTIATEDDGDITLAPDGTGSVIISADTTNIYGETFTIMCKFGTVAASTDDERGIFVAPFNCTITAAYLMNATTIATSATAITTLTLNDKGSDGTSNNAIAAWNCGAAGTVLTAFDAITMGALDGTHKLLTALDTVTIKKVDSGGTGAATDELVLMLSYKRR